MKTKKKGFSENQRLSRGRFSRVQDGKGRAGKKEERAIKFLLKKIWG
jgi:hypothetical protein